MARLVVVWRVTESCDTSCAFCAYDVRLRRPRRALDADEALRFGRLVAGWARGREVLISWLGGEPLLWGPLARVSAELRGLGLAVGLTTNGRALASEERRTWAASALDELTLSIDGPPALHDGLRGGGGARLLEILRDLRAREPRPLLRVNTVLMRGNAGAFAELCALVEEAGADELTFNALGGRDRPEFFPANGLRPADLDALAAQLPRLRAGRLRVRGSDGYLARLRAGAAGRAVPVDDCGPGRDAWFIEVDGRLAPCSFTVDEYGVPISALTTVQDLDTLPDRLVSARAARRAAACGDCPSTQVFEKFRS